jgi:hypothetical protein
LPIARVPTLRHVRGLRGRDRHRDILIEQEPLVFEYPGGMPDLLYVRGVIAIALLRRRARIAGGEPLLWSWRRQVSGRWRRSRRDRKRWDYGLGLAASIVAHHQLIAPQ